MKAIFYATSTGNTEEVANKLHDKLNDFELIDIASDGISKMKECTSLIIGSPTWGEGDLQDDWESCFDELKEVDFNSKNVALFGLGDQESYCDEFVNAMGTLYEIVKSNGANVVGFTSIEGYDFSESTAVIDDEFVGLAIDEDNQPHFTDKRITNWIDSISKYL